MKTKYIYYSVIREHRVIMFKDNVSHSLWENSKTNNNEGLWDLWEMDHPNFKKITKKQAERIIGRKIPA